jgi:hypothetical protein
MLVPDHIQVWGSSVIVGPSDSSSRSSSGELGFLRDSAGSGGQNTTVVDR